MKFSAAIILSLAFHGGEAFSPTNAGSSASSSKTIVKSAVDEAVSTSKSGSSTPKDPLLIRAAKGEKVERTPVWMMRQAGRYLPEYIKIREKYDFFT